MIQQITTQFLSKYSSIGRLQWFYVLLIVLLTVIAGLVALLTQVLSLQLLELVRVVALVFVVNLVSWALVGPYIRRTEASVPAKKRP